MLEVQELSGYIPTVLLMIGVWWVSHQTTKASTVDKMQVVVDMMNKRLESIENKIEKQYTKEQVEAQFSMLTKQLDEHKKDMIRIHERIDAIE